MNLHHRLDHLEQQLRTSAEAAAERDRRGEHAEESTDETRIRLTRDALRKGGETGDKIVALFGQVADRLDREGQHDIAERWRALIAAEAEMGRQWREERQPDVWWRRRPTPRNA